MAHKQGANGADVPASPHENQRKSTRYTTVDTDEHSTHSAHRPAGWLQRIVLDTWIPEIIAVTLGAACLAAIIIVLAVFQNKTTPQLPWIITLNAVVSILATASHSMLMCTVATALGQLKWCWYQKRRILSDLQTFDDASRGPWGSLDMLVSLQARPLASIGALITLLALAFDPFVQQVLTYPNRLSPTSVATPSIFRATMFAEDLWGHGNSVRRNQFVNAVNRGIWSGPDMFEQQPVCQTGNCTWPLYQSIGWCSRCVNAISNARMLNCTENSTSVSALNNTNACSVDLGTGNSIQVLKAAPVMVSPGKNSLISGKDNPTLLKDAIWMLGSIDPPLSVDEFLSGQKLSNTTYLGIANPVIALGRVSVQWCKHDLMGYGGGGLCITAAEQCVLSLCEKTFSSSVTNGSVSNNVASTNFGVITQAMNPNSTERGQPTPSRSICWQRENLTTRVPEPNYLSEDIFCPPGFSPSLGGKDGRSYSYAGILADHLVGNTSQSRQNTLSSSDTWLQFSSSVMQYINTTTLDKVLQGVAASLSSLALEGNTTVEVPGGKSFAMENYVSVAWQWLILPIVLEVGAIVILAIAISESRRYDLKLWKTSILPLLYFGLEPETAFQNTSEDVSSMAALASGSEVRLAERPWKGEAVLVRSRR